MTRSVRTLLAGLCVSLSMAAHAQADPSSHKRDDYDRAIAFFHEVQQALKQNDPGQVALLVHYPLRVDIAGHGRSIYTRTEFVREYPRIFTSARRAAIVNSKDSDVWWRDQGYSIEYGVIWFDRFMPPGQKFPDGGSGSAATAGAFGIMTVNEAKEEAR